MQNKGSMLAFTFVLMVMCLGAFAAFSALTTGRASDVVAQATATHSEDIATRPPDATAAPTDTPSDVAAETPSEGSELSTPVAPSPTPVAPSTPTLPPTATPTPAPSPTKEDAESAPPPSSSHQYRVIRNERDCSVSAAIGGWVYDSAGNGLPGVTLVLYNDYGWRSDPPEVSEGPPQTGKYEFPIGNDAWFHLAILDSAGQPISPVLDVDYQPDCKQRIDWERVG